MRKIAAHYIFPIHSKPLKNGILVLNDDGSINDLIDTQGDFQEQCCMEYYDGIIVPGFVNAHCHIELSHLKNKLSQKTGLSAFVKQIIHTRAEDDKTIADAIIKADEDMRKNGIVAVGDISNNNSSFAIKAKSNIFYHNFIETFGLDESKADVLFNKAYVLKEEALSANLSCSIVPHAPYSGSDKIISLIVNDAFQNNSLLSIHLLESNEEKELFQNRNGKLYNALSLIGMKEVSNDKDSVAYVINRFSKENPILFIHNTFIEENDIKTLKHYFHNPYFVLCPKSNLFIENALPNLELLIKNNCTIALGTDSLASNDSLSILEELMVLQSWFPSLSIQQLIAFATLNGAKALQIDNRFGSFEKGKSPRVNLITNINFEEMKFTSSSKVKILV